MQNKCITVLSHFGWGMYRYRLDFLCELVGAGWEVTAIADWSDGPYEALVRTRGVQTRSIRMARSRYDLPGDLRTIAQLFLLYRGLKPDVAQHFHTRPMILGAIAARLARVPKIVNCVTGLGMLFSGKWNRLRRRLLPLYRLAFGGDVVAVFQNDHDLDYMVANRLIARNRTHLVRGSGVDTEALKPDPGVKPKDRDVVIMASRMMWSKGVKEFVEAAEILRPRFPDIRFLLAGGLSAAYGMHNPDDIDEAWLKRATGRGAARWLGHLEPLAVETLFRRAAVVVLPSFYPEGLPRCLIEGAAAGAPVVTTDMPGCRDAILAGVSGLLCPPRSSEKLAQAIAEILADRDTAARMSAASRRLAVEQFDVRDIARAFVSIYNHP